MVQPQNHSQELERTSEKSITMTHMFLQCFIQWKNNKSTMIYTLKCKKSCKTFQQQY
uniref:Uncharacterized protein n=1 Tax=Anguilla anguilla TaxID=7936 RepID=A0A0E9P7X1_ANGAN